MTLAKRKLKLSAALILSAVTIVMLLLSAGGAKQSNAAEPVSFSCPFTYQLLYNGKIKNLDVPKGYYSFTLMNKEKIVCSYALENFKKFLQNVDQKLQKPWVKKTVTEGEGEFAITTTTFKRGKKSPVAFSYVPIPPPSSLSTTPITDEKKACKGSYKVKSNKSIVYRKPIGTGTATIPKGSYRLAPINKKNFSCSKSAMKFRSYLKKGRIPNSWNVKPSLATFYKRSDRQSGFYVTRNYADKG